MRRLATDEASGTLPRFVWITPNLCHDMHDCSVATGDRFLAGVVPPLLASLGRSEGFEQPLQPRLAHSLLLRV